MFYEDLHALPPRESFIRSEHAQSTHIFTKICILEPDGVLYLYQSAHPDCGTTEDWMPKETHEEIAPLSGQRYVPTSRSGIARESLHCIKLKQSTYVLQQHHPDSAMTRRDAGTWRLRVSGDAALPRANHT